METIEKKAAIYVRTSTKRQAEKGVSIALQEEECRKWCIDNGYTILPEHVYADPGYSGALESRPAFDRLRKDAKSKQFELLVFYEASRLARDYINQKLLLRFLDGYQVKFKSITESMFDNIESFTDDDELMADIYGSLNSHERRRIARRTKAAKRKLYGENKLHPGPIPYGYRKVMDKNAPNCVEIDPVNSQVFKRIVDLYLHQGTASHKIANILNEKKIKSPKYYLLGDKKRDEYNRNPSKRYKWTDSTILRIIQNEAYTGKKYYLNDTIQFNYEPLISRKDWAAMNRLRETKFNYSKNDFLDEKLKEHFLTKKALGVGLRCAICGSTLSKKIDNRRGNYALRYYCQKQTSNKERLIDEGSERCSFQYIDADIVDDSVWRNITYYLSNPVRFFKELSEAPNILPLSDEISSLEKELKDVKDRIRNLNRDLKEVNDEFTRDDIKADREVEIRLKDKLEKELRAKRTQLKDTKSIIDFGKLWRDEVRACRERKMQHLEHRIGPDGIARRPIILVRPFTEQLNALPFKDKLKVLRQIVNPTEGGLITVMSKKGFDEEIEFEFRSKPETIKSLIKKIGGSDAFIQRLSKPRRLCASR